MKRLLTTSLVLSACLAVACSSSKNGTAEGTSKTNAPTAPATAPVKKAETKPADTPVPLVLPEGAGTIKRASFKSTALGVDKDYVVYLPPGYDADTNARYPVIFYLHGLGGRETNWSEYYGMAKTADKLKLGAIVIMPDGDDGFYVNAVSQLQPYERCMKNKRPFGREADMKKYCVHTPKYEDYMTKDLLQHVDATYRTLGTRAGRGIAGLSMGGYGALMLSMRNKNLYAAAASHAGVASLIYKGPFPYEKGKTQLITDVKSSLGKMGIFGALFKALYGTDLDHWKKHDPTSLAQSLKPGELHLYMDCGTEDEFRLYNGMQYLHEILEAKKIAHDYWIGPGRHNGAFWSGRLPNSLGFFKKHLAKATTKKK